MSVKLKNVSVKMVKRHKFGSKVRSRVLFCAIHEDENGLYQVRAVDFRLGVGGSFCPFYTAIKPLTHVPYKAFYAAKQYRGFATINSVSRNTPLRFGATARDPKKSIKYNACTPHGP